MLCLQLLFMNRNAARAMTIRFLGLALLMFAGGLALPQPAGADEMQHPNHRELIDNPVEIKRLLPNQTSYGRYTNGEIWTEYQSPDGRTAYEENNCIYRGHWWIAGSEVCYRY